MKLSKVATYQANPRIQFSNHKEELFIDENNNLWLQKDGEEPERTNEEYAIAWYDECFADQVTIHNRQVMLNCWEALDPGDRYEQYGRDQLF